ncbi:MAG TPA: M20/M25/M40 family metallo-hydrolase [Vicinamibacterales bacterium]|nr:M20/M25/M40 family metallo-hydrolase [Vicinamibacterales bacterium]
MRIRLFLTAALLGLAGAGSVGAQSAEQKVQAIVSGASFRAAQTFLAGDHDRFVRELITLTEIPAPPFKEQKRGAAYLEMLRAAKLADVETDPEGNVMGVRKGTGGGPMLAVLAHLDTVFPEGTDVTVKRNGNRLLAPGAGDDTGALALMLSVIRAMDAAKVQTPGDILFVGNVGEEGEGDLRGAKYLLQKGKYKDRIKSFISIDGGAQDGIVNGGLGSRRYRVAFKGPGGHSYGAFGLVSPAFAMGNAMTKFSRLLVPASPRTTFNVGVVGGGTSVNSIPTDMFMLIDMRSESPDELKKVDEAFQRVVREAVDEENRARSTAEGKIVAEVKLIGDRPSGTTPTSAALVRAAAAVARAYGYVPSYEIGSTDANVPISMGIPAITIGRGAGGRSHSLDEWIDVTREKNVQAGEIVLATIMAAAEGR